MGSDVQSQQSCHLPCYTCIAEGINEGLRITFQSCHIASPAQDNEQAWLLCSPVAGSTGQVIMAPSWRSALAPIYSHGWECWSADGFSSIWEHWVIAFLSHGSQEVPCIPHAGGVGGIPLGGAHWSPCLLQLCMKPFQGLPGWKPRSANQCLNERALRNQGLYALPWLGANHQLTRVPSHGSWAFQCTPSELEALISWLVLPASGAHQSLEWLQCTPEAGSHTFRLRRDGKQQ